MYYSAEVRWFQMDPSDEKEITAWFNKNGEHYSGHWERADIYLLVKNLTTHGIKLREGKLEIKILTHEWERVKLADHHEGNVNMWTKYSFSVEKGDNDAEEVIKAFAGFRSIGINRDWIRIDKERLMVKYKVDADQGTIKKVDKTARPEQGCNVEVTRLKVNLDKEYHTFNFEAFGKGVNVRKILDIAVAEVFSTLSLPKLKLENSLSFPEFIASLSED